MATRKILGKVLVEAAPEGLFGLLWIKIDGQKPIWLTCSVLKQLVKPLQVHIAPDLLVYLFQLVLVFELEEAQERAVLADGSW